MPAEINARFALNTYSYTQSGPLIDLLPGFAEAGFSELELMIYPRHLWPLEMDAPARRGLRDRLDACGLTVRTLNQPNIDINVTAPAEPMRRYSVDVIRSIVTLAGELGVEGVVIGPGKANPLMPLPADELIGWTHEFLDEMLPVAAACGTQLLMENMPFAFLPDADAMMSRLEHYGAEEIGVVYDVANAHFIGEDLAAGFARVAPRLHSVHLSDTTRQGYAHSAVGCGDVDFTAALSGARAVGHARAAILEIVSRNPDAEIEASARQLAALGWG